MERAAIHKSDFRDENGCFDSASFASEKRRRVPLEKLKEYMDKKNEKAKQQCKDSQDLVKERKRLTALEDEVKEF